MMTAAALTAALIGIAGTDAEAQGRFSTKPPAARGFISANGIYQATATTFTDHFEFQEFVETGTIESSFEAKPAIGLEGSFGVRVFGNIGLGGGVSTYAPKEGGTVVARIPHPLQFNQHREVTADAGLSRKETAIHGSILYFMPVGDKVLAVIGAGPTYFQAEQSFVNRVLYDQQYPFDEVTVRGIDTDNESASGLGFNASLDVSWRFSKSFGAGGIIRYATASLPFTPGDRERKVNVGGLQAGLGLRVIF
jgi:hypothetical protein